jgi:hypothetical protein
MGGNLTNLEEQQAIKIEFVLKTGQDKKVLIIKIVMKKSQKDMERSVEGKGKSFINLLAQELVGKTSI